MSFPTEPTGELQQARRLSDKLVGLGWIGIQLVLVGLVRALWRRRFSADAFALFLSTMLLSLLVAPLLFFWAEHAPIIGIQEVILWGGTALTMLYGGALVGVIKRKVGVWESYLALLLVVPTVRVGLGVVGDLSWDAKWLATLLLAGVGFVFAVIGGYLATLFFRRGLVWWVLRQVGVFLWLILQVLGVGTIREIVRRRFHWGAWAAGLSVMEVGIGVIALAIFVAPEALYLWRDVLIWGGSMAVMTLAGVLIGKIGRRVGFWECHLASVVITILVVIHLAKGWHVLFGFGPNEGQPHFEFLVTTPPGVQVLGSMWDRMVALGAVAGFLLAVFGGSLAYLFFGEEGQWEGRFGFERIIGARHLFTRRRGLVSLTAVVTVIGVAVGVAALVAVTAVMSGYQGDIQTKILSTNAHFVVQKYGIDFTEYESIAKEGLTDPEVLTGTPFTFNEAMLATPDRGLGVLLKGVVPAEAGTVTGIERNLCRDMTDAGECERFSKPGPHLPQLLSSQDNLPSIVVGSELWKKIGLARGAVVSLTTPIGIAGARGNAPRRMEFRLGGAFRSGMHDFDARLAYLDLDASQQLMGLGQAVNGVEFKVKDPERVALVAERVLNRIGRYPFRTLDWRELNIGIFTALKLQKIVMFLVLTFIVVVAAFNIASTLFMAVVEKAREIAVLKSMGARDGSVMKIFVLEGWIVGGIGTALGLALGLLVCAALSEAHLSIAADVYMVESLTVRVRPVELVVTALAALIISHLATLYPALKAAREKPVDAMRYD